MSAAVLRLFSSIMQSIFFPPLVVFFYPSPRRPSALMINDGAGWLVGLSGGARAGLLSVHSFSLHIWMSEFKRVELFVFFHAVLFPLNRRAFLPVLGSVVNTREGGG